MSSTLLVGAAEVEITPPVGTPLAGSLVPRPSHGTLDPLFVKAMVLESGNVRLAYAIFDLVGLDGAMGARLLAEASAATGIPAANIVWSCTHTHSGPVTINYFPATTPDPVDHAWMNTLPAKFAACVAEADRRKAPACVSRVRGYHSGLSHNRRLRYKDGREINTWLLNLGEDELQCIGAAGPIDPEIVMLAFDDAAGTLRAVLFHFALHANARGGDLCCADYPGVVAARLREAFGPQVVTLFLPGACGDLNPVRSYREIGDAIAETMLPRLRSRRPLAGPLPLGITSRRVTLPLRDPHVDQDARLLASQWPEGECREYFRRTQAELRAQGRTSLESVQLAWHLGDTAFATFPGEAFVELGQRVKRESPFPWTLPVELCNDEAGYFVTDQAWAAGGYEGLVAYTGLVAPEGSRQMVETNLELLAALWRARKA